MNRIIIIVTAILLAATPAAHAAGWDWGWQQHQDDWNQRFQDQQNSNREELREQREELRRDFQNNERDDDQ